MLVEDPIYDYFSIFNEKEMFILIQQFCASLSARNIFFH